MNIHLITFFKVFVLLLCLVLIPLSIITFFDNLLLTVVSFTIYIVGMALIVNKVDSSNNFY